MKTSYTLFRIFGIPVSVDLSLLILLFLLVTSLGGSLLLGLLAGFVLLLSILLHELGHSLVGMAFGGRVLNIQLMMLGGCASIANMPRKGWQEILMAFAGPFVSLMLWITPAFLLGFLSRMNIFEFIAICFTSPFSLVEGTRITVSRFMLFYAMTMNFWLFCFNMLPAFPMDGGRILRATLQQFFTTRLKATWIASRTGRFVAILMAVYTLYLMLSGEGGNFLILRLFIAYMIFQSAEREYLMVLAEERGPRHNPFAGFPFFGRDSRRPPDDDGQAVISPPPYDRGSTRVDVRKDD